MNQEFERNAKNLGFVKEKLYELEKGNVCYQLPNQKLPFLKKDFRVKNSYADFVIADTEVNITIYDGSAFDIELNHYRKVKGSFDKDDKIKIEENSLNEKEKAFYMENEETIEKVLRQLEKIHKSVYKV